MFYTYFLLFIIYSIIGWILEIIFAFINLKKFVNRGFLIGPYCPIYGAGCLLLTILLSKYAEDTIVLFALSIIICSILEYLTSWIMEKIFKLRWWDYSDMKFNINGRICLETMIPFGIIGSRVFYLPQFVWQIVLTAASMNFGAVFKPVFGKMGSEIGVGSDNIHSVIFIRQFKCYICFSYLKFPAHCRDLPVFGYSTTSQSTAAHSTPRETPTVFMRTKIKL